MTTLYLTEPGTIVRCHNHQLLILKKGESISHRLAEISLVLVMSGVQLTWGAIATLLDQGIETIFIKRNGQFRGRLQGQFSTNPTLRLAQYRTVETPLGLELAQKIVIGKIRNQRTLLQRRNRATRGQISELAEAIDLIQAYLFMLNQHSTPLTRDQLMGIEGICARAYYQGLKHWFPHLWKFTGRNRQPPQDPINALLSWGYGVLLSRVFALTVQVGLDPYLGFFHAVQPSRPNLVLDLMEEFRPIIVDHAAIALIQSDLITPEDFEPSPTGEGIWLGSVAKKLFLSQLEKRFNEPNLYPPENRRLKLKDIILAQARWISRCLQEQTISYEPYIIR